MGRVALTVWYTLTTLVGPCVCCCSFAATPAAAQAAAAGPSLPASPVKSCCHTDPQPCGEHGKQNPDPSKPSKCPCEHGKQHATSLPAGGQEGADLVAQLKLIEVLFVGFMTPSGFDLSPFATTPLVTSPPASKPAGRTLLAAYSLLRC